MLNPLYRVVVFKLFCLVTHEERINIFVAHFAFHVAGRRQYLLSFFFFSFTIYVNFLLLSEALKPDWIRISVVY